MRSCAIMEMEKTTKSGPKLMKSIRYTSLQTERERVAWLHPGELTAGTQKLWFASDDVPFQLGDSFRFHLTLPKVNMEPKN